VGSAPRRPAGPAHASATRLSSTCKMRCSLPFTRPVSRVWCRKGRRGQRLLEAPGDNRHPSTALACSTGAMASSMAGSLRDAPLMCSASKYVPPWLVPAQRGRVAIVIADNLKTHTPAGSLLVRSLLSEFKDHLYVVYTPAYDPDANRIEWRCAPLATSRDP
jgi:hypothetical protein